MILNNIELRELALLLSYAIGDEGEEWYIEWMQEPFEGWDGVFRWTDPARSDDCFSVTRESVEALRAIMDFNS